VNKWWKALPTTTDHLLILAMPPCDHTGFHRLFVLWNSGIFAAEHGFGYLVHTLKKKNLLFFSKKEFFIKPTSMQDVQ
jgi:hypothetical protein